MNKWNPKTFNNCGCYNITERETIEQLFLKGEIADKVWNYYCGTTDIIYHKLNLKQNVRL